ncbi:MAG: GxxExxY protein [Anaerolineae bacterium]|nr:GxxExxY protein [Anaerolineae bacterium]
MDEINGLTEQIIEAAIEVHRHLGPGLLAVAHEEALAPELQLRRVPFARQVAVPFVYNGHPIGDYRLDLLVGDSVIVEIESVERHDPVFEAQLLTYLRLTGKRAGLPINLNTRLLRQGVKRLIL